MIITTWLSTLFIKIDGLTFTQDCYCTSMEGILLIDSKHHKGITTIVESWSFSGTEIHGCKQCKNCGDHSG